MPSIDARLARIEVFAAEILAEIRAIEAVDVAFRAEMRGRVVPPLQLIGPYTLDAAHAIRQQVVAEIDLMLLALNGSAHGVDDLPERIKQARQDMDRLCQLLLVLYVRQGR